MTLQLLDTTAGAGDTGKAGGDKINANFNELYLRANTLIARLKRSAQAATAIPKRSTTQAWNPPPAWTASSPVHTGIRVVNGGNIYTCITAGTTASSGGPTGTSPNVITDNSAQWYYVGATYAADVQAPVFSVSTTAPTLGRFYQPAGGGFSSGAAVNIATNGWFKRWGMTPASSTSNLLGGNPGALAGASFETDALTICFAQGGYDGPYNPIIEIDGRYLTEGVVPFAANSGTNYTTVTFPYRKMRRIVIRAPASPATPVAGVYCDALSTLYAADDAAVCGALSGMYIGDSFAAGVNLDNTDRGLASWSFAELGIEQVYNDGQGGTGFTAGGSSAYTVSARISTIAAVAPDVLAVMCSVNDAGATQAALTSAINSWYASARGAVPNAIIIVYGVMCRSDTGETAAEGYARLAFAAFADPLLFFVPASGAAGGAWGTGTGTVGAPTGVGNGDYYWSPDNLHPAPRGHEYLARRAGISARNLFLKS